MAPTQPKGLNRRQLLGSAAGIAVSGIVPATGSAHGAVPVEIAGPQAIEPLALNVCDVTARRIAEIAARNRIREEAGLPLLSIPKELRRMKTAADAAEFEAFADLHRGAVWGEVLAPEREARGDPNWRPTSFMEGLRFQSKVNRILRSKHKL